MYLLAFYAFLRVGEITKTTGSNQHYLLRKHLKFVCNTQGEDYLELTIPHYKHSKNVATLNIKQNTAQPALCPLKACQTYLLIRSHFSKEEPLFSFMDGTPISRKSSRRISNNHLRFVDLTHTSTILIASALAQPRQQHRQAPPNFKSSKWAGGSLRHLKNISEFQP